MKGHYFKVIAYECLPYTHIYREATKLGPLVESNHRHLSWKCLVPYSQKISCNYHPLTWFFNIQLSPVQYFHPHLKKMSWFLESLIYRGLQDTIIWCYFCWQSYSARTTPFSCACCFYFYFMQSTHALMN